MTQIRLALGGRALTVETSLAPYKGQARRPSILVSYAYWKTYSPVMPKLGHRSWVLDSGAMTVWNSGGTIELGW